MRDCASSGRDKECGRIEYLSSDVEFTDSGSGFDAV